MKKFNFKWSKESLKSEIDNELIVAESKDLIIIKPSKNIDLLAILPIYIDDNFDKLFGRTSDNLDDSVFSNYYCIYDFSLSEENKECFLIAKYLSDDVIDKAYWSDGSKVENIISIMHSYENRLKGIIKESFKNKEKNMKNYVSTTLQEFLNENLGKNIIIKRKYGDNGSIIVGTNAPLRNKTLCYINENKKVSKKNIKDFMMDISENKASESSISMWLKRNYKYFITEQKNDTIFYRLSDLGKRLVEKINIIASTSLNEGGCGCNGTKRELNERRQLNIDDMPNRESMRKRHHDEDDFDFHIKREVPEDIIFSEEELEDQGTRSKFSRDIAPFGKDFGEYKNEDDDLDNLDIDDENQENIEDLDIYDENQEDIEDIDKDSEHRNRMADYRMKSRIPKRSFDFEDRGVPGIYDMEDEMNNEKTELDESKEERIRSIIDKLKNENLNEEDEINLDDEDLDIKDEKQKDEETEENEINLDDEDLDIKDEETEETEETEELPSNEDKVEITDFIITVENVEEAIKELDELGIQAERVPKEKSEEVSETEIGDKTESEHSKENEFDEEYEPNQIKVPAYQWGELRPWLESKGLKIDELFGEDVEVEVEEEPEEDIDFDSLDIKDDEKIKDIEQDTEEPKE